MTLEDGLDGRRSAGYRIARVHFATRTEIACPAEQVFDMVADLRNETRWSSRVSSAELRTGEPIERGSRFSIVNGGTPYEVTITTYDRPSRLVVEASGRPTSRSRIRSRRPVRVLTSKAFLTSAQEEF